MTGEMIRMKRQELADQHDRMVGLVAALSIGLGVRAIAALNAIINY